MMGELSDSLHNQTTLLPLHLEGSDLIEGLYTLSTTLQTELKNLAILAASGNLVLNGQGFGSATIR
jgi:hypothetical protein